MSVRSLTATLALLALGIGLVTPSDALAKDPPTRQWLDVELGQSNIQASPRPFHRVLISDPAVAELKLLEEGQFQIRGLSIGTTDLWVWYRDDPEHPQVIELTVHRDLSELIRRVGDLVADGPPPHVYPMEDRLVLEGPVPDLETLERIAAVAKVYDPEFVNLMTVKGDHQVQLLVTFAEVSRTAERQLGLAALYGGADINGARVVTGYQPFSAASEGVGVGAVLRPAASAEGVNTLGVAAVIGDPLNLALGMEVLERKGVIRTLAEPTLVALSGQKAEFLSGGEVPIPVQANDGTIKLEFKAYGVQMSFVPTVLAGEVIDIEVQVEVSEVNENSDIRYGYIDIPAFDVSKATSHVRLDEGMTFALAGLIQEESRYLRNQVPGLGEIPVLGTLFSYTEHFREETELMIFITPHLVRPMAADEVPPAPGTTEDYNPNDFELFFMGMDHRAGSRTGSPSGPVGAER